jgi:glycosyltransferase involved in cell wall biosynthesis
MVRKQPVILVNPSSQHTNKIINVVFLIRSLNFGGSERQLEILIHGMDKEKYKITVLCFYGQGKLQKSIEAAGVKVISLEKKTRWDVLSFYNRLVNKIKELQPDVLYAFLPIPNIVSVLVKLFIPGLKVIFGVRISGLIPLKRDWTFSFSYWLEQFFSRWADRVIVNAKAGKAFCINRGISEKKIVVINNGINLKIFAPDVNFRNHIRTEWGIPETSLLIGVIGRITAQKDLPTFLSASAKLVEKKLQVRFVCVGDGETEYRQKMIQMGQAYGLKDQIRWCLGRNDMPAVYNALDICCLSSRAEGFPNVVGEAMACGVPCVVTDVGDSANIVGDTGKVVRPGHADDLAEALLQLLELPEEDRKSLGLRARQRIEAHFAVEKMVRETQKVIDSLVQID